jgi:hypothetical protein
VDPTNEERKWFGELTADAAYPRQWRGLTYVEGLAETYPDVIDYYLHNRRERLDTVVGQLSDVIRLGHGLAGAEHGTGQPLSPADVESGLTGLYAALNAHDPHYRYSFSVDAQRIEVHNEPFLLAVAQRTTDVACVTFRIYAKFAEGERERPVPIAIGLQFPSDAPETEAIQDFNDFGAPVTVEDPDGDKIEWSVDLPGGLSGTFQGGRLSLGPAQRSRPGGAIGELDVPYSWVRLVDVATSRSRGLRWLSGRTARSVWRCFCWSAFRTAARVRRVGVAVPVSPG